ncbi:hypothetical protein IV84_GL001977 [Pediococcus damnosus]|uniref:serine hydrolase domain-containing protein n=1 Tax=Pediococcus damnosus TaxID=51663 RepID=UPI000705229A|nr:serine hydrolase domain-containing protein [Pediococcus damnosus]KRN47255.1 hypothetical protein IV84_GL001977 [Pediococcus damnosus]
MKKHFWQAILITFFLGVILGGAGFAYYSYRMAQEGYPVSYFRSAKQESAHKSVTKTFIPRKVVVKQPRLNHRTKKLKQLLKPIVGEKRFVGTVLIIKNGHQIYNQGYGYANISKKALNTANSEYQILSMQKSMTAMLIMQQIQAGNLQFADHLDKFYPEIPGASQITIRSMLDMQTGLRIHS